ncbi:phage holin family protein [Cellulomonas sp. ES6]|uniref:phage holin family protein n=1 Tax=Cellulomonas sp. ES6 TaxID=3039384 RepID=UPI0019BB56F0|nr:phage holin family protein [Cellulomonas sp. ES6]MBD3781021.1 phage holin family protein [Micrococcales bacterium]WHP16695.1 phage holin family protein [Cellulomonas sp. ES6]
MVIFLIRVAIFLGSAALGLGAAALLVDDVHLGVSGFVTAVVVFTAVQAVLTPFIATMARRYANAFLGGVGLVSTWVALLVASAFTDGLRISGGVVTWIAAVVIVWLVTALATWLLPMVLLRKRLQARGQQRA